MRAARTRQGRPSRLIRAALAIVCTTIAPCGAYAQEAYLTGGTLGVGPGLAINLGTHFGLRADIEGMGFDSSASVDGGRYEGRVKLLQGGLYGDLFPFASNGFRLSAGVLINDDSFDGHAVPNALGNYVIGNTYVPAVGPAPEATITLPRAMPYIGLGYGHRRATRGFGLAVDLGVAYGRPRVAYNVPSIYQLFATPANIALEEQRLNDKVSGYRWYPVAQITLTYRF
ncbi:hypothetical protein [Paraburkholderia sp. J67]|uniref:hypothetical protein n=1 Tax=Paraburkholderia sp. J67 TaxID=2805435 RepID=UPI002ABDD42F|nr:hypothetical protein [Paraburkholderia sp. J67]